MKMERAGVFAMAVRPRGVSSKPKMRASRFASCLNCKASVSCYNTFIRSLLFLRKIKQASFKS